ncbi:TcpQ domain-containing protein [Burkholderia orbicola]|uniref:TcpQ domain-containing protein n=1 Tax=Burkholderia cepacia complex TaxID=87882 RepID=UPI001904947F|nr:MULTISPECIES: TcpQ domain-containing protein [Burkholderia cepacia complex]MBJ9594178.1 toxin co-regulated pilus biosynthesis Q family protein [Burkholderia seminalis]MDN7472564.1 TcpQ domain-containing protein [Burkholderia orbicola]MDN7507434.1 TcpQ domain-containing protein [Burkholderia orbicola]
MRKHINGSVRSAVVAAVAHAISPAAIAGDLQAQSNAPAIHLAPYLARYNAPAPVALAGTASIPSAVASSDAARPSVATNVESNVAPAGSLSPSETVIAAPLADAPATPLHHLVGGVSLESQLREWAKSAGWSLSWNVVSDWIVPNDADYAGDFPEAATKVLEDLAANGADVRGDGYLDNRTFVVHEAGND